MANYAPDIVSAMYRISLGNDSERTAQAVKLANGLNGKSKIGNGPKSVQVAYRARGFESGYMRQPLYADYEAYTEHMENLAKDIEETKKSLQSL